jgi:hypothetical protein
MAGARLRIGSIAAGFLDHQDDCYFAINQFIDTAIARRSLKAPAAKVDLTGKGLTALPWPGIFRQS